MVWLCGTEEPEARSATNPWDTCGTTQGAAGVGNDMGETPSAALSRLTIAPGQGMAPPAVRLADGPVGRPLEGHSLLAAEGHHSVQGGARPLQPAVGQDAGRAAVDL